MHSMTGFGKSRFQTVTAAYRLEARSLNHRFLEVKVHLPWNDVGLESRIRERAGALLNRGRLDINVQQEGGAPVATLLQLDEGMARQLSGVLDRLQEYTKSDRATAARLLPPLPELLLRREGAAPEETEAMWEALGPALDGALSGLLGMRAAEGQAHRAALERHISELTEISAVIGRLAAGEPEAHRARVEAHLARLLGGQNGLLDPARQAQEVSLLADRSDITEELDRLGSHLAQLGETAAAGGAQGRRIEFLLQELHRELNTMGSKTQLAELAHKVVDAKSVVERMRELSLNVE